MKKKIDTPDQQLVTNAKKGDRNAFDLLVIKYQFRVRALVAKLLRDSDDVDDVTQDTFVSAFRALRHFRGDSQFFTWLYRIAINTAKNHSLSSTRRAATIDLEIQPAETGMGQHRLHETETPETRLFCQQLATEIRKTIDDLPEDMRAVVSLREYADFSYDEIAEIMNCPTGTVRSRLFRAREIIDRKVLQLLEGN